MGDVLLFALITLGVFVAGVVCGERRQHGVDAAHHTRLGHYLSTYCLHGNHAACRLTCKICDAPCRCVCHSTEDS